MGAVTAGWNAFMKGPESQLQNMTREERFDMYATAWAYYRSKMFSTREGVDWSSYLATRGLYKHTRLIYNPVPMLVDFYVDNIWERAENENFPTLATPLNADADEKVVEAVAQLDQWSMWLAESTKIKRYAAATGNVLVEGVDDLERGKILHKCVWPGYVYDVELNQTGDLQSYVLEYEVWDREAEKTFTYRKEVTKESYRYFYDGKPWVPPGKKAAEEPNDYQFIFAVWFKHIDDGSDYGIPACCNYDKVDNVNALAAHFDDYMHRDIESPKIIGASGDIVPIVGAYRDKRSGRVYPEDPRLNWMVLKADTSKGGVSVDDLSGVLKLGEASPELDRQLKSFEHDYPELQAATIMRENAQLSGAALERMLGPAQNRLDGVQPGYNQQLIKLRQMGLAVGGMRANRGGWMQLTDQQKAFLPFSLKSYEQGDLEFTLKPSQLVHETEEESENVKLKKAQRAETLLGVGIDELEALQVAGYTEEEAQDILKRGEAEDEIDLDAQEEALRNAQLLPVPPGQRVMPTNRQLSGVPVPETVQ
jgi:hypothetical protein